MPGRQQAVGEVFDTFDASGVDRERSSHHHSCNAIRVAGSAVKIKTHAVVIGMPEPDAVEFYEYWKSVDWKDKDGLPVRNWKAKLSSWMNRPELESTRAGKPDWRAERAAKEYPPNAKPRIE